MANSIIGMNGSIGARLDAERRRCSQPHWKIATTTP